MEIREEVGRAGLESGHGFRAWKRAFRGCTPREAGEREADGAGSRFSAASKKQAGNIDPVMVAWRRAVVAGE